MNKTRFALTSALVLLGFGLMAGDCDCKTMAPRSRARPARFWSCRSRRRGSGTQVGSG